ncbi:MAG TPA: acetate kinase, partial [Pricia sp.]|nr:acetate kinase [Pricia sp.]
SATLRKLVCADMDYLGLLLDDKKNKSSSKSPMEINTEDSKVKILVIPTNEELEIAKQVFGLKEL